MTWKMYSQTSEVEAYCGNMFQESEHLVSMTGSVAY